MLTPYGEVNRNVKKAFYCGCGAAPSTVMAEYDGVDQAMTHFSGQNAFKLHASACGLYGELLITPSSQRHALRQSVQVLENTMDWIPACAGMTNF